MAFGSLNSSRHNAPVTDINMVPLIDVLLVLLVIFMVTAPLLTHAVKLDLPQASSQPNRTPTENITLSIQADGRLFWQKEELSREALQARLRQAAAAGHTSNSAVPAPANGTANVTPAALPPVVHLYADTAVPYGLVAQTLADITTAGLTQVSFISTPKR